MKARWGTMVGFLATILIIASHALSQEPGNRTQRHRIESSHVGDEYVIDVHLPDDYNESDEHYPVVVVLDGDISSGMARDIVELLVIGGEIPQLVVVAISYGGTTREWWDKRSRDLAPTKDSGKIWGDFPLAGGGEAFREFLRTELVPFIETNYRIKPDRTLAGLSLGGSFAVYSLFTAPEIFNRYIIAGPALAWDKEKCWEYEADYQEKHSELHAVVFTGVGELDESAILDPWERFNQVVESRGYEGLTWVAHKFEGETHFSCWSVVFTRGIKAVYSDP